MCPQPTHNIALAFSKNLHASKAILFYRYFPFDTQNCSMLFASWTYAGSQINLMLVDNEGDLSNYIESRYSILILYDYVILIKYII